jgi:hypothetical protein
MDKRASKEIQESKEIRGQEFKARLGFKVTRDSMAKQEIKATRAFREIQELVSKVGREFKGIPAFRGSLDFMDKQESKETQELVSKVRPAFRVSLGSMDKQEFKEILELRATLEFKAIRVSEEIPGSKAIPGRGFKALQASRA